jgi:primosomal protein N' (replication factor Y) (superfamily II helicase)
MLGPAPRFRRRGRYRRRMLLKCEDVASVTSAIAGTLDELAGARELRGVAIAVDVDPQ